MSVLSSHIVDQVIEDIQWPMLATVKQHSSSTLYLIKSAAKVLLDVFDCFITWATDRSSLKGFCKIRMNN